MKSLKLFLVMAIAASSFTTVIPKKRPVLQKAKEVWKKHKAKIIAGAVATAAIGAAAVGLAYHGNKTKKAIEEAGIIPNSWSYKYYNGAVKTVGFFGPLGERVTLELLQFLWDAGVIDKQNREGSLLKKSDISKNFVLTPIGDALAYYFGAKNVGEALEFREKVGEIIGISAPRVWAQRIIEGVEAGTDRVIAAGKRGLARLFGKK